MASCGETEAAHGTGQLQTKICRPRFALVHQHAPSTCTHRQRQRDAPARSRGKGRRDGSAFRKLPPQRQSRQRGGHEQWEQPRQIQHPEAPLQEPCRHVEDFRNPNNERRRDPDARQVAQIRASAGGVVDQVFTQSEGVDAGQQEDHERKRQRQRRRRGRPPCMPPLHNAAFMCWSSSQHSFTVAVAHNLWRRLSA